MNDPRNQSIGRSRSRFWLLGAGLCLAGLALALWQMNRRQAVSGSEAPRPADTSELIELSPEAQRRINLKILEVAARPLEKTLLATGAVAADQSRLASLRPLTRGVVERVLVQLGDRVKAGQPLMRYDNIELGELLQDYLGLRAEIAQAEAQAEVARSSLARAEALLVEEAIAKKEYELRAAQLKQAVAAVESQKAAQARVEEKIHRLGWSDEDLETLGTSEAGAHRTASHNELRAPFAGVITRYDAAPGELLEPDREVFTLADTSVVWVLADIYEKDLGQVRIGQTARVRVPAYPEEVFTGKITYLGDILDPVSRTSKLRCVVANGDGRLKLDMFATVEIPLPVRQTALAVPEAAVQTIGEQTVVFLPRDTVHFEKRAVEVGERAGEWVEIRVGLRPGEKVVADGAFYLKSALLREQISGE